MPRWAIDITAGTGGFESAIKRVPASTKKATSEATRAHQSAAKQSAAAWSTALKAVGVAGAIGGAIMGIERFTHDVIDMRNELADTATRAGSTAQTIQTLSLAAEGTGLNLGDVSKGLERIPKLMLDADHGLSTATRAFDDLGISIYDSEGKLRDTDPVFRDIVKRLGQYESATERAAHASDIFGQRAGGRMVQAIGQAADQFENLDYFANRWGVSTAPEALAQADRMQREFAALGLTWRGAKDDLADLLIESEGLKGAATIVAFWASFVTESMDSVRGSIEGLAYAWHYLGKGDFDKVLEGMAGFEGPAGVVVDGLIGASKAAVEFGEDWDSIMGRLSGPGAQGDGEDGDGPGGKIAKGFEEAARVGRSAIEDLLSDRAKLNLAYEDTKNKLLDIMDAEGDESEAGIAAGEALRALNNQRLRQLDDLAAKQREAREKAETEELEAERRKNDELIAEARRLADERLAIEQQTTSAKLAIASSAADFAMQIADLVQRDEAEGSKRGVALAKTAGIAGVAIDAAGAVMGAWDAYGDIPFVGPILAAAQTAVIAGIAGVQTAQIASAYTGLDTGYAASTGTRLPLEVHPGERVRVETRSEVERGRRPQQASTEIVIGARPVAYALARDIRAGGPAAAEITRRTGRLGHSQGWR